MCVCVCVCVCVRERDRESQDSGNQSTEGLNLSLFFNLIEVSDQQGAPEKPPGRRHEGNKIL